MEQLCPQIVVELSKRNTVDWTYSILESETGYLLNLCWGRTKFGKGEKGGGFEAGYQPWKIQWLDCQASGSPVEETPQGRTPALLMQDALISSFLSFKFKSFLNK